MTEFKDVAHLYLGCSLTDGKSTFTLDPHLFLYGNRVEKYKPLLRPLSDMTEEEKINCLNETIGLSKSDKYNWDDFGGSLAPKQFIYLLKQGFDLFGLIESGQAINLHNPSSQTQTE